MANADTPFGMRLTTNIGGRPFNVRKYSIPSTYNTAVYLNDPVVLHANGSNAAQIKTGEGVYGPGTLQEVNRCTVGDGNFITGVVLSFDQNPDYPNDTYGRASTTRVCTVCDDPNAIYEIQADGAITAAEVGLNAVLIATQAGSTVTGLSGLELDTSSDAPAADASNQLTILGFVDRADNEIGAFAKMLVRINQHTNSDNVIGI